MKPSSVLTISAEWERLDEGAPEERACFAAIGIWRNDISLTAGHDSFVNIVRKTPYLSGYHLAEWIAWNWWRLRWEPRTTASDWAFRPSPEHDRRRIRLARHHDLLGWRAHGACSPADGRATDHRIPLHRSCRGGVSVKRIRGGCRSIRRVHSGAGCGRRVLRKQISMFFGATSRKSGKTRPSPQRRTFEALLGREPDAADDETLRQLETDSKELGQAASHELAAHHDSQPEILRAKALRQQAACHGFDIDVRDSYRLPSSTSRFDREEISAWYLGSDDGGLGPKRRRHVRRPYR